MMTTRLAIKTELIHELMLIKESVNIMEYLDPKYFKQDFIEEIKKEVYNGEGCKCKDIYVTRQRFNEIILDIILQYKTREDIKEALENIFNVSFTKNIIVL